MESVTQVRKITAHRRYDVCTNYDIMNSIVFMIFLNGCGRSLVTKNIWQK